MPEVNVFQRMPKSFWMMTILAATLSARAGAEPQSVPREILNGTFLDYGQNYRSVGFDRGGSVKLSDARCIDEMSRLVSGDIQKISPSLVEYSRPCVRNAWINEHWRNPVDGSSYSLAVLDRKSVLQCVETTQGLSQNLRTTLQAEIRRILEPSQQNKPSLLMSITIDSVYTEPVSLLVTLRHWYLHKTFIRGTIHGDLADSNGKPMAGFKIKATTNSWFRNPSIGESLGPLRGSIAGDRSESETTTDTDGRFSLPFSGYVGIRDYFGVYLENLDAFFVYRERSGNIYAKYFYGYDRVPITKQ